VRGGYADPGETGFLERCGFRLTETVRDWNLPV
jgi:hypothetical protein